MDISDKVHAFDGFAGSVSPPFIVPGSVHLPLRRVPDRGRCEVLPIAFHRLPLCSVPGYNPVQAQLMKPGEYLFAINGFALVQVPESIEDQLEVDTVTILHCAIAPGYLQHLKFRIVRETPPQLIETGWRNRQNLLPVPPTNARRGFWYSIGARNLLDVLVYRAVAVLISSRCLLDHY
jgi:hypothetical protein